jgi:hypothetical protein
MEGICFICCRTTNSNESLLLELECPERGRRIIKVHSQQKQKQGIGLGFRV